MRSGKPMKKIVRGSGTTPSEKYLAKLADKTFLNLWSYPNLFIDKMEGGTSVGKELCDLLVVCGDDIIIFSDKSIEWQKTVVALVPACSGKIRGSNPRS
jgi:hypothetical protein